MQRIVIEHAYPQNIPLINRGFDRYELNNDLAAILREAETATFYHNALNPAE